MRQRVTRRWGGLAWRGWLLVCGMGCASNAAAPHLGTLYTRAAMSHGLVTRRSALLDQRVGSRWSPRLVSPIRWTSVTFLSTDHIGLTKDAAFTDNVLFLLLEQPRHMTEER